MKEKDLNPRDPVLTVHGLRTSLEMERAKYAATPVKYDMAPFHVNSNAYGYVVVAYHLIEKGLKSVARKDGGNPPSGPGGHVLCVSFDEVGKKSQSTLKELYKDFIQVSPISGGFREKYPDLDSFLKNLDGGSGKGSFDWRYLLTEEPKDQLPDVCIDAMHEVADGCVGLLMGFVGGVSHRLSQQRENTIREFLNERLKSPDNPQGPRLEKLWGPDYRGWYNYALFEDGGQGSVVFGVLPEVDCPVVDLREVLSQRLV